MGRVVGQRFVQFSEGVMCFTFPLQLTLDFYYVVLCLVLHVQLPRTSTTASLSWRVQLPSDFYYVVPEGYPTTSCKRSTPMFVMGCERARGCP